MMKIKQKMLSLLMAASLVTGLFPTTVLAVSSNSQNDRTIMLGTSQLSDTDESKVYFGTYQQSSDNNGGFSIDPISWSVLDSTDDTLFLLSDKILDIQDYNHVRKQTPGQSLTWEESSLRSWLTDSFLTTAFTETEQGSIAETRLENLDNGDFDGGNDTKDKVFVLSLEDAQNTNYFSDNASRAAETTDYVNNLTEDTFAHYWLRNPGSATWDNDRFDYAASILGDGAVYLYGLQVNLPTEGHMYAGGIRPAFNLTSSTVLFSSAAVGVKSPGNTNDLVAVTDYTGSDWKLTLLDDNHAGFSASTQSSTSIVTDYSSWTIDITYSGAQTGNDNEYVSVLLCDSSDNVLYYGNIAQNSASGTATLNIPSGLAVGNYTLKVFSEQCNGDYKTDYASAFQNISLQVTLPQEEKPDATFTATSDNGGTLSDVDTSMKYSVDNGNTWNDITGTTMEITGVTAANDVKVYKPGNGTSTSDSEVQTIDVTQADQPEGIDKVDCTTSEQNNGQITNVSTEMEYMMSTDSGWTGVTGSPVTGLTNGTYYVRVKANGTVLASPAATVIIGAHTCVAQGDWQYDGDNHWKLCACGAIVDQASHSGGTATCLAAAKCEVCGQPYGQKDPANHTGTEAWITTDTTHTKVYSCCQAVIEEPVDHTWENGKCTVCGYNCEHTGGTATCSQLAQCEICGSLYGDYDADNHKASEVWTQENDKHYHICEYGCDAHLDEADCSGGTATCTTPAVCEICGQSYGSADPDNHTGEIVWTQTETTHFSAYNCCGAVVTAEEEHTFEWVTDKEATATETGLKHEQCTICGYEKAAVEIPATGTTTDPSDEGEKPSTGTSADDSNPSADDNQADGTSTQTNDNQSDSTSIPTGGNQSEGTTTPATGDDANVFLWSCLALGGAVSLVGTILYHKKRKYN